MAHMLSLRLGLHKINSLYGILTPKAYWGLRGGKPAINWPLTACRASTKDAQACGWGLGELTCTSKVAKQMDQIPCFLGELRLFSVLCGCPGTAS